MASPIVQTTAKSATATAGTSHVITLPSGIAAGDLILFVIDKGTPATTATFNAHADYQELLDENVASGLAVLYRWAAGGESNPTLVTSASIRTATIAFRISGANSSITPQIGTTGTGTSATPDPPASAAPPSTKDYLFIAFAGMAGEEADDDTWGNTPPTNYTPNPPLQKSCGTAGTNLGGLILAASRQLNTGSAEDPGTFGVDVSAAWRSQTITIHPIIDTALTPSTKSLTVTTFAPTVTTTNNVLLTPSTKSLTLSTFAPTVLVATTVTPATKALTVTTFAPSVVVNQMLTPATKALTVSTFAPSVAVGLSLTPGPKSLTITTFAPSVTVSGGSSGGGARCASTGHGCLIG